MLLQEGDQSEFKRWLLPKLENISDAEAPVLADYVIALVIADDSEPNVQRNCIESLEDFLGENTQPFVNDVIAALKDKSYLPQSNANEAKPPAPQSIRSIVGNANFEYEPHPSNVPFSAPRGPAATRFPNGAHTQTPSHNAQWDGSIQSRKRKLVEGEAEAGQGQDSHYNRNGGGTNRPLKQTSRGRGGRNIRGGGNQQQHEFHGFAHMPNFANLPPPPPGPLPFDPTDPAAFFAMAAAFGANLPPVPTLSFKARKARCTDYHNKGFCAVGSFCPFEHEGAVEVPAEEVPEYDPEQSFLAVQPSGSFNKQAPRGLPSKTRRPRTTFSRQAKHLNHTNTTIVVEPIPKEHLGEDSVQGYFSQFGSIVDIEMQEQKRLAIVKYEDNAAAAQAYTSSKAIFDNRFIKVYWYNADDFNRAPPAESYGDTIMGDADDKEEEKLDPEEIARRQAEAQKAFDERRRKVAAAEARAAEIEQKLKETNEEMESIRKQLVGLSGDKVDEFSQNLADLQAEADSLFAQHEPSAPAGRGRDEVRGDFRGRGRGRGAPFPARGGYYPPRGGSWTSFVGANRDRADFVPVPRRNPNRRLDNRPRRFAVAGIETGTPKDEALRQYLLNVTGCTSIERHPEKTDTLILTFDERYQAEAVFYESNNIPDVGKLDVAWVPNDAFGGIKPITTTTPEEAAAIDNDDDDASSATIGEQEVKVDEGQDVKIKEEEVEQQGDADMDVADDVDQWL